MNSTNVRSQSPLDPWPIPRRASCAPRVALALWSAVVAVAGFEGVFARLEPQAYAALIAFAIAFTLLTAWRDREVRESLQAFRHKLAAAVMIDAVVVAALAVSGGPAASAWTHFPAALALLVLLPVTLVLHAAAARGKTVRTAPGASPGAKRAAT